MDMGYYRDLREFVAELDRRGKLWRYSEPINKDTELIPFHRLQLRGVPAEDRRAILFERPVSSRGTEYSMSVLAGVYGASRDIHVLGMGCNSPAELQERWHQALSHPIEPVLVESAPVHEEVHTGKELEEAGLEALPVPVEEPGYSGMIRTGTPMVTRDPITGKRNAGAYNAFFRSRTRMAAGIGSNRQSFQHWLAHRKQGELCPVAIVVGPTPNFMAAASAPIPAEMDEYAAAGGLVGEPMELVRCKTIPLEVPATAEIVIEGWFDSDLLEPRVAFGEYPGYLNPDWNQIPVIHVSAITHRRDAIFTPVLVGFTPSDTNVLWGPTQAGVLYHKLRYEQGLPVLEVHHPEVSGGSSMTVLRMERDSRERGWETLEAAARLKGSKWFIAVDEDIDPSDPELLLWALTYSIRSPDEAVRWTPGRGAGLDPSAAPPHAGKGQVSRVISGSPLQNAMVNAMRPWAYPPVALPAKEYMERALELWHHAPDAPELKLRAPWHGYTLGHWTEDDQLLARLMTEGEFLQAGDLLAEHQTHMTDAEAARLLRP
jgi:4-hydroxy-3-polyprenylbenzoate decarboxylase